MTSDEVPPSPAAAERPDLAALVEGLDPADLRALTMAALDRVDAMPGWRPDRPSQLRPRRVETVTLRVRVELAEMRPPVWRRLELASDLELPVVHEVLQAAMGWTDSHLHRFAVGSPVFSRDGEEFLTAVDLEGGDEGTPEGDVRLDQVLVVVGDRLFYSYDFGDGWEHTVRLEAVLPRADDAPRARCTGGRRACPPEDCGGPWGYSELLQALSDPEASDDPDVAERLEWAGDLQPEAFDVAEADALVRAAAEPAPEPGPLPPVVADLVQRTAGPGRCRLLELVTAAALLEVPALDAATTAALVRPYTVLLERVGSDGIALSAAGYLPPSVVTELLPVVDPDRDWIGASNRESHTLPVLAFRESAQEFGLVRRLKGRLVLTPRGRALRSDPAGLLAHLASRLPLGRATHEQDAGHLVLLAVAGGRAPFGDEGPALAEALGALGWMGADGSPVDSWMVRRATDATVGVLRATGALVRTRPGREDSVTAPGLVLARMALVGLR